MNNLPKAKIEVNSGSGFDILNPDPDLVNLNDIALGLSRQSRFAGQGDIYYSVAEHAILALAISRGYLGILQPLPKEEQIAVFMHDAHEAYIRDLPSPLKQHFPEYNKIGERLDQCIAERFSIAGFDSDNIREIDMITLSIEAWKWMPAKPENWTSPLRGEYKEIGFEPLKLHSGIIYNPDNEYNPDEACDMFLLEAECLGIK
jgi:hypothetical protein